MEAPWVRSVYLYTMCAASVVLILLGLSTAAIGIVHTAAPDLGHRDTLDRVGIGLSNVGTEVVDLFNDAQLGSIEAYCETATVNRNEYDECVEEEQAFGEDSLGSIQDGIAEVKDELRSQIRNNSVDRVLRGLFMVVGGVVLFRIHGRRTELFADGVMPKRRVDSEPAADAPPATPLT